MAGMLMRRHLSWIPILLLPALWSCTSDSGDKGFAMDPPAPTVRVGEQLTLTAQPQEDLAQEPEWEIKESYGGGFLNTRGLRTTYIAPVSAGRYTLILRSVRPNGTRVTSTHLIHVLPIAQVEPSQIHLAPGGSATFTVRMKGVPRGTATWSVEESNGGSVSADGYYQAPGHSGLFHVVATSTADPEAKAIAVVQVD